MKTITTLGKVKVILYFIVIVFFNNKNSNGQPQYMLDLADASTFSTTCGTNNGNLWTVSDNICSLTTTSLRLDPLPAVQNLMVSLTMEGASMDNGDTATIEYSENGEWHAVKYIVGEQGLHTYPYRFSITASGNSLLSVRISLSNNAKTESWRIWSGSVTIEPESPMPVTLLCFSGERYLDGIRLGWSTANETNCDFFTVERSPDAKNFVTLRRVPGAGNSSAVRSYTIIDTDVDEGLNFYRLTQTDYNGSVNHLGSIISVNFCKDKKPLHIYPNPNDGSLFYIHVNNSNDEKVLVVINDESGRVAYSRIISYDEYSKTIEVSGFDKNLAPGIYLVTATCENDLCKQKIIVK